MLIKTSIFMAFPDAFKLRSKTNAIPFKVPEKKSYSVWWNCKHHDTVPPFLFSSQHLLFSTVTDLTLVGSTAPGGIL